MPLKRTRSIIIIKPLKAVGSEKTSSLKAGNKKVSGKEAGGKKAGSKEVSRFPADFAIALLWCSARSNKEYFSTYFLKLY